MLGLIGGGSAMIGLAQALHQSGLEPITRTQLPNRVPFCCSSGGERVPFLGSSLKSKEREEFSPSPPRFRVGGIRFAPDPVSEIEIGLDRKRDRPAAAIIQNL